MNNWQRLEQVIKWTGMSTNAFAITIGLKRSENLYQIKRGNFGISKELARLITTKYPLINRSWLLTGDGNMLNDIKAGKQNNMIVESITGSIPFYQVDIVSMVVDGVQNTPLYYMVLPMFNGASFAAPCYGTSMEPVIPQGSTLIVRDVADNAILPGEIYLVVTENFVVLRRVRYVDSDTDSIRLTAEDRTNFDDMIIKKDSVSKFFLVMGIIINKHM